MPKRNIGLSLPQGIVDEAEMSGGAAGEMVSVAPLMPAWSGGGSGSIPAAAAGTGGGHMSPPKGDAAAAAAGTPESPKTRAKVREQIDAFRARPVDEQVHELSTALLREHLAKHAGEVAGLRDAFEAAFPRDAERTVNRRSVICNALDMAEPAKAGTESLLETLVRRLVQPPAVSLQSGVFTADSDGNDFGDGGALRGQSSMRFDMSPDGLGVNINGLNVSENTKVQHYRVKELSEIDIDSADVVGKGAGGRVLKARHLPSGEWLAVKEIYLGSDEVVKQIEAEISVMWGTSNRHMHHVPSPFLVNCQGIFYREGTLYIVMELMDGSLKDALDVHKAFREEQLLGITYQILYGLQYMHYDKKQLHRDIKPHNVLYNRSGWVKLTDFGIASDKMATASGRSHQTFCGTLLYMSPSRAEGESYSYEADIWSLGMTLWQLAFDSLPTANNLFEIIQLRSDAPRVPANAGFSENFRDFMAVCLDPDATASTTVTVRQLLMHPWLVGMSLEKSQRVVQDVFKDVMTRTQRVKEGHKPVGFGTRDDIFATLDEAIA